MRDVSCHHVRETRMISVKGLVIGAILFVALGIAFNYVPILSKYGIIIAGIIAGITAVYIGKIQSLSVGAITGLLAAFIGGLIICLLAIIRVTLATGYTSINLIILATSLIIVLGEIFGIIGGIMGAYIVKKRRKTF